MRSITDQMLAYAAYHKDLRNKLTHFVGVPLVVYSLFVPMGWFRFVHADIPLTGATVFFFGVFLYYLRLDWVVALFQAPVSIFLLWLADQASLLPFGQSVLVFLATFVGGWIIQLIGHYFEGRRPALVDNALQVFNAPLFLTLEILFLLGFRKDQRALIERAHGHGKASGPAGKAAGQNG